MPVGKESIKRAANAGSTVAKKKTTTRKATAKKVAPETVNETVLVPDEQVAKFVVEGKKEGPIRITEELPIYLL